MKIFADSYQARNEQKAQEVYNYTLAIKLPATSPVKLDNALNVSVFYYQVLGDTQKAIDLSE